VAATHLTLDRCVTDDRGSLSHRRHHLLGELGQAQHFARVLDLLLPDPRKGRIQRQGAMS
jgi:hypothetical protein